MSRSKHPSRSRDRWDAMAAIHAALDAMDDTTSAEWDRLATLLRELSDLERTAACRAGWPVWQRGQHFAYVDRRGRLREGQVHRFDRDAKTVLASTWDPDVPCQDLSRMGMRQYEETIALDQIFKGEAIRNRIEDEESDVDQANVKEPKKRRKTA